ncbi:MAG: ABC transporter permease [Clostridia bacterium]|nr:ABC transporter permease [Clostridia bacterium]
MNFSQAFKMAMKSISSSKLRTFLTMLGIIIGVCAVIVLVSVVQGSTGQITESIESLGANAISVNLTGRNSSKKITYDKMDDLIEEYPDLIKYVVPNMTSSNAMVKRDNENITTSVTGTNSDYMNVNDREIMVGRFINSLDTENRRKNAVVGTYIVNELFGGRNPVGENIKINNEIFKVVGVLEAVSDGEEGSNDDVVIVPYTAGRTLFKTDVIRSYSVWATTSETVDSATDAIKAFLYRHFRDEDEYIVISIASMMDAISEITDMMAILTAGIAGISLVVGGIGIMNIMLVSVTERTREIGIRKAIGARRASIMTQFLIESIVVSSMGGIIGILLGTAGSVILGNVMGINAFPKFYVMLIAFMFSAAIGIFFGWAPANKASKLNPIDALHAD